MSHFVRKSIRLGPLRLNISKSGLGLSLGVNGARIASGPSTVYVIVGRNATTYRHNLGGVVTDTQCEDILARINSGIQQRTTAWTIIASSTALAIAMVALASTLKSTLPARTAFLLVGIVWLLSIHVTWVTYQQEKHAKITFLEYLLDESSRARYLALQNALEGLAKSACIWHIKSTAPTWDWKRNAGASSLVKRERIKVECTPPPFIQTEMEIPSLSLGSLQIFFLPDNIYVFGNRKYRAASYASLHVDFSSTVFIEEDGVPPDSQVVGYTWRYIRKGGGPDMRFRDNSQIPKVMYGYLKLASHHGGVAPQFHVSNLSHAQRFAQTLTDYSQLRQEPRARSTTSGTSSSSSQEYQGGAKQKTRIEMASNEANPYVVLRVSPNASWEEITTAYRGLARLYHPDKVTGLAPEFLEIAEIRMKAINRAYETLKRSMGNQGNETE